MKLRSTYLVLLICTWAGIAYGADRFRLNIERTDGEVLSIEVSDGLKCEIEPSRFAAYGPDGNLLCDFQDVARFHYSSSAGVGSQDAPSSSWRLTDSGISITCPSNIRGNAVSVYSDSGLLLGSFAFGETVFIPFDNLPSGILLFVVNNGVPIKIKTK